MGASNWNLTNKEVADLERAIADISAKNAAIEADAAKAAEPVEQLVKPARGRILPQVDQIESGVRAVPVIPEGCGVRQRQEVVSRARGSKHTPPATPDGEVDYADMERPTIERRSGTSDDQQVVPESKSPASNDPAGGVRLNLSSKLSEFIRHMKATPNTKMGCVDFSLQGESTVAFRRFSDAIKVGDQEPDDQIILAMLELGRNDFGEIEVFGTPEFIEKAVAVAIKNNIVLQNREYLQAISNVSDPRTSRPKFKFK